MRPEVHLSNDSIFATAAVPVPVTALKRIQNPILLVHGRDDMVCSVESSYYLLSHLQNAQLHVYGKCGHWTQIEKQESFNNLIQNYFSIQFNKIITNGGIENDITRNRQS